MERKGVNWELNGVFFNLQQQGEYLAGPNTVFDRHHSSPQPPRRSPACFYINFVQNVLFREVFRD